MRCYVVKNENAAGDYKILKVPEEKIADFQKEFAGKILFEGQNIQALLMAFSEAESKYEPKAN